MTEPAWAQRFRATSFSFPAVARDAPDRYLYLSNTSGRYELYTWNRRLDQHTQVTSRPQGTWMGKLTPDGESVWWFADTDGDEYGLWMRQPFDISAGTSPEPAMPGLPSAYPAGLALGRTSAAIGLSDRNGVTILSCRDGGCSSPVYTATRHASVRDLSYDETLLAIQHSEHGDAFNPALRVLHLGPHDESAPETIGDLWDGPGQGLRAVAFAPCSGDARLLVQRERSGRVEPLIWDLRSGTHSSPVIELPGDVHGSWYPDGDALLLRHHWRARDELYRYDLTTEQLTRLQTPTGAVDACAVRPDGAVEYEWSSAEHPQVLRADSDKLVLTPAVTAPPSVPLDDAWVDSPGGSVHALIARPADQRPAATVFLLHGGPGGQVTDSFWPSRSALVDAGYCVIHLNYRGSSGYGVEWRDADRNAPGLVELEDVAAVQDWAVRAGISDPDRCVLAGISWGGYLSLLGLGTQADRWAAGIAAVPIGDLVALYEDEMEPVREHDRSLFGGTPDELPDKWQRSNPITYVDNVEAPVLVIASRNDPHCPIRQVENYLAKLTELGKAHESYLFDSGHFSLVTEEHVRQMALQLDFLTRNVPSHGSSSGSAPASCPA